MKATVQKEVRPNNDSVSRQEFIAPEVNIFETKESYVLELEMPGVDKEGLEVTLEDNEITIVGHRRLEQAPGKPVFRESRALDYRRAFELDPVIDTSKISAKIEQGLLTVALPKSERVKPRKITVD